MVLQKRFFVKLRISSLTPFSPDEAFQMLLQKRFFFKLRISSLTPFSEEALRRLDDLKSGKVKELSEEEFWKPCGRS